ncbi:MAG: nucleotidyltransferase family protein [Zoogloeaceae bacterium]|nr:nucleotidyltransferase family protein [Zoogloeaceae bacterium]
MGSPEGSAPAASWVTLFLAAGQARRFGADKLLAPLPGGEAVAIAAARNLLQGLEGRAPPLAVLRPEQTELGWQLSALGFELLPTSAARKGLGCSIAAGVAATAQRTGWLLVLADMPAIQPTTVATLARQMDAGASAVAPFHEGRRGHPVGFGATWGPALRRLQGDRGARDVLGAAGTGLIRLDTDDAGVLQDIDTPTDLTSLASGDLGTAPGA